MKEQNLIKKFRSFFFSLPKDEQEAMWDIMSAIRSEDGGNSNLKTYTTSRVRGTLLEQSDDGFFGAIVMSSLKEANKYQSKWDEDKTTYRLSRKEQLNLYRKADFHWQGHLRHAIRALRDYGFKSKVKDLGKFLKYS